MDIEITFDGKPMTVQLTPAAEAALRERATPLVAELELYFSCLIRKRVCFHEGVAGERAVAAAENLYVSFRPVMTEQCQIDATTQAAVTDFPIANPAAFVPHRLRLDHRHGEWQGEFGYL